MLKSIFWLGVIIVLLLAASYIWRDDFPWLARLHQELGMPPLPTAVDQLRAPSGKVVVYRWQDEQGNWHFDSQPPRDRPYERLVLDPDVNLMPGGGQ